MKLFTYILAMLIIQFLFINVFSSSIEVGGHITTNTTWNVDTVNVIDSVTVDSSITLTINPGTFIEFQGQYKIKVDGRLRAIGKENDSIIFTMHDTTGYNNKDTSIGGWHGIYFTGSDSIIDSSIIAFCKIEFVKDYLEPYNSEIKRGAIYINGISKIRISNSTITNTFGIGVKWGGIFCEKSNALIINNLITKTSSSPAMINSATIECDHCPNIQIINNVLKENKLAAFAAIYHSYSGGLIKGNVIKDNDQCEYMSGIHFHSPSNTIVANNIIINSKTGISIWYSDSTIHLINNTIANNSYVGLSIKRGYKPLILNNIIWDNSVNVRLSEKITSPIFKYCDIQGGKESIQLVSEAEFPKVYENNIDRPPLFSGTGEHIYSLLDGSPCINRGIPDTSGFNIPSTDIEGNPRIIGGRIDIGAYEYQGSTAILPEKIINYALNFAAITINTIPSLCREISVYNLKGSLIFTFKSREDFKYYYRRMPVGIFLLKITDYNNRKFIIKLLNQKQ